MICEEVILEQTIDSMNNAFPDSNVENFEDLITSLKLPDNDDRHVLACAIRCKADLITTFNIKDFPDRPVGLYAIEVQNSDQLITNLIDLNEAVACAAFIKMVKRLKKPSKTKSEIATTLRNCGLTQTTNRLENNC